MSVPVVAIVAILIFLLIYVSPGDPAQILAGDTATPAQIEAVRHELQLDSPPPVRFLRWFDNVLKGDLGASLYSHLPVRHLIAQRLEPSLALGFATILLSIVFAVPLGVLSAWNAGSYLDRFLMNCASAAFAIPPLVVAFALIWVFAIKLAWFPVQGYAPASEGFTRFAASLFLPVLTLAAVYSGLLARVTRTSLIEVLNEDFIRTAHAKGATPLRIMFRHALPAAAIPVLAVIGNGVALLMSGVVVTETLFNVPGMGRLVADAILRRDYPVIQGVMLVFSILYILINLAFDVLYLFVDPRTRSWGR